MHHILIVILPLNKNVLKITQYVIRLIEKQNGLKACRFILLISEIFEPAFHVPCVEGVESIVLQAIS